MYYIISLGSGAARGRDVVPARRRPGPAAGFMPVGRFFDIAVAKQAEPRLGHLSNANRENGPDAGARPATPGAGAAPGFFNGIAFAAAEGGK